MNGEFKPCPFCGHRGVVDSLKSQSGRPAKRRIQCPACLAATRWCDTEDEAWAAWNMRSETDKKDAGRDQPQEKKEVRKIAEKQDYKNRFIHKANCKTYTCFKCKYRKGGKKRATCVRFKKEFEIGSNFRKRLPQCLAAEAKEESK